MRSFPPTTAQVALFDAANMTFEDFLAGKGAFLSYVAAGCWVAYVLVTALAVALAVSATSEDIAEHSAKVVLFDLLLRGAWAVHWPFACMWIAAELRLGITIAHFIDYDKTERKRAERLKLQASSTGISTDSAFHA